MTRSVTIIVLLTALVLAAPPIVPRSAAQEAAAPVLSSDTPVSGPVVITAAPAEVEAATPPVEADAAKGEGEVGEGQPQPDAKPGAGKPDEAKPKGKEETAPKTVQRPVTPPVPPDKTELDIILDRDGRVRFNFRGQAWPDVLQWLADVSQLSLDWQELPADYLTLITQRRYGLEEARDLINRHLLARGFTTIVSGDVMSVVKLEGLNVALVPRVEAEQLASLQPHQFARVSFPLDWLIAENAAEELKPMLGPHGKLVPMLSTNRLEAIDTVANLREIHGLLGREQSADGEERLVREFVLEYARADEVDDYVLGLLGVEPKSRAPSGPMSPEQMQMMQQQMQMMAQMQHQQQQEGGVKAKPARPRGEVNVVVNPRRNSLLVNAPPDKMAIIAKAVETIDVPSDSGSSLLLNSNRMQVYRLAALDPEVLAKSLQEAGDLEPTTRLQVDKRNKAIIAYASLADHVVIRTLVEKLDGSGRRFEVLRLRRLPADYVAGTVSFMMGPPEEEPQDDRSRYYGFFGFDSRQQQEETSKDRFRVDADVENNRLLVWANDIELEEIRNLLVKLGEIPSEDRSLDRVRVLDVPNSEATREFLERVRDAWPSVAPNPLLLPTPDAVEGEPAEADSPPRAAPALPEASRSGESPIRFAQLARDAPAEEAAAAAAAPSGDRSADGPAAPAGGFQQPSGNPSPPVRIDVGPDGRLILSSDDAAALDALEDLLAQLAPRRKDYKLFPLKFASAFWVRINLQDFFKEEKEDDARSGRRYYFYDAPPPEEKKTLRLSQRRPLKFIDDLDTNSVLVVAADADQLRTIEELIKMWDVPPPSDSESARVSAILQIRYSKAQAIAAAVKEVYRDLLSANDKSLQEGEQAKRAGAPQTTYIFGEEGGADEPERRTQVAFRGKLSIGVDEISNTLLVSTEGQNLMENVAKMVEALDEAARPLGDVQVVTLKGNVNADVVRAVLANILDKDSAAAAGLEAAPGPKPPPPGMTGFPGGGPGK